MKRFAPLSALAAIGILLTVAAVGPDSLWRFGDWKRNAIQPGMSWTLTNLAPPEGHWAWPTNFPTTLNASNGIRMEASETFYFWGPLGATLTLTNPSQGTLLNITGTSFDFFKAVNVGPATAPARVGGTLFTQTNIVGITQATFRCAFGGVGTTNLPANFFEAGRSLLIDLEGVFLNSSGAGAHNYTNKLMLGSTALFTNMFVLGYSTSVEIPALYRYRITPIATGASGKVRVSGHTISHVDNGGQVTSFLGSPPTAVITIDTTAAQALALLVASSTPDAGQDYLRITGGTIKIE